MTATLFTNIGDLVSLEPLARSNRRTGLADQDLGRTCRAWLAVSEDGRIEGSGTGAPPAASRVVDCGGGLVMPGLVDSHAHLIFGGSRAGEFCMRANGATYQEIAAKGGGIRSTMTATRGAADAELARLLDERLGRLLRLGITTVEAKSGYGLSVSEELRLLRLLRQARDRAPQHVAVTCLALHAASPEHHDLRSYADACTAELLPAVKAEGLAEFADAFIEQGYFSVADTEAYARKAVDLGLRLRLHADEFTDAGAASAAAAWGAASADHLQFAGEAGIRAMARAGVTATLLPGTSLYTKIPFTNGRRFADAGVPVALATDFNPGSCRIDNLALLATVAAVQSGLKPAEVVAAVTYVPAVSLGVGDRKGTLAPGWDADVLVYPELASVEAWLADFGRTAPTQVWVKGRRHV